MCFGRFQLSWQCLYSVEQYLITKISISAHVWDTGKEGKPQLVGFISLGCHIGPKRHRAFQVIIGRQSLKRSTCLGSLLLIFRTR